MVQNWLFVSSSSERWQCPLLTRSVPNRLACRTRHGLLRDANISRHDRKTVVANCSCIEGWHEVRQSRHAAWRGAVRAIGLAQLALLIIAPCPDAPCTVHSYAMALARTDLHLKPSKLAVHALHSHKQSCFASQAVQPQHLLHVL